MKNILDYIEQVKDMYNDQDPRPTALGPRNMYNQGQLVQPNADGSRPGYAGNKGYVKPLSPELQKLFNKTNSGEEWGKGKFANEKTRGNWKNDAPRKQKILNATSNLITEDQLSKILTEELGEEISRAKIFGKYGVGQRTKFAETVDNLLFKGKFGSIASTGTGGGSIRYFKKPSQNDIKKILKSKTLGDVRINTLKTNTVKNVLKLNKKYADIYKAGKIPDIELVMKATNMTEQSAGTATARLAQIYNGHKFNNKDLKGIRVNTKTASKMFEIMDKSPFGNPYRNSLYKVSLATIDEKLGNEIGTFEGLKKKATKILKDNKIPVYDFKKGKKAFGFNINEIAGATGSAKSKAAEFSQFIDVMEGNLNQKTLANFQGQLSIARQNIEDNPDMLSSESKRINKLAGKLERQYDIDLPRLRDPDATKYFSPKRLKELEDQGLDIVKAAERAGYTIEMPKGSKTISEFTSEVKNLNKADTMKLLKKMGYRCLKSSGGGESVACYMSDVEKTRADLKSQDVTVRAMARTKQRNALKVASKLPQIGKIIKTGVQLGTAAITKPLQALGLTSGIGYAIEGIVEGGFYDNARRKGYNHQQAMAETLTPGLIAGRPEDVPWHGGAEKLREKELIGDPQQNPKVLQYVKALEDEGRIYDAIAKKEGARDDFDLAEASADIRDLAKTGTMRSVNRIINPESMASQAYNTAVEKRDALDQRRRKEYLEKYDPQALEREKKSFDIYVRDRDGNILYEKMNSPYKKRYKEMKEKFPGYSDKDIKDIFKYWGESTEGVDFNPYKEWFDTLDKQSYYADNFRFEKAQGGRAGYMGGGIAAIRKPSEIPPERQGLRSIMINAKDN